jgi:hypothetical protein
MVGIEATADKKEAMEDNEIPPAEAGGLFNSSLPMLITFSESHRRKPVDCSFPAYHLHLSTSVEQGLSSYL